MELKRYDLWQDVDVNGNIDTSYDEMPDGDWVKLSDIKEFLGIGDCDECACYDCEFMKCQLFDGEDLTTIRHPDCIKTFGE